MNKNLYRNIERLQRLRTIYDMCSVVGNALFDSRLSSIIRNEILDEMRDILDNSMLQLCEILILFAQEHPLRPDDER